MKRIPKLVRDWWKTDESRKVYDIELLRQDNYYHDAVILEDLVAKGSITLAEARYALIGKWPETNNISQDNSVNKLILPRKGTAISLQDVDPDAWENFLYNLTVYRLSMQGKQKRR